MLLIVDLDIVAKHGLFWPGIVTYHGLICDVTRTCGIGIVMSYSSIVFAWANSRKGDFHLWITTVNIDISPPGIHGLGCKKKIVLQVLYSDATYLTSKCTYMLWWTTKS